MFNQYYAQGIEKIIRNREKIGAAFPHVANGEHGEYNREPNHFWTNGFWGGLLWLAYRESKNEKLFETVCEIEDLLDEPLNAFLQMHHDVGFIWIPTALAHYRATGCEKSRVRCLKAASILAGRFNPTGRFIRAWNEDIRKNSAGIAIIDCLMNIPLLYWASKETGDPRFKQIAMAHADTILEKVVREDFTVPHIVRFDEYTGEKLEHIGGQGKGPDSVWSRGQSWAIYGFALSYRETGKQEYLEVAKNIGRKYMELLPEDGIPYWDFSTDEKDQYVKDTSSACCVASGMLEIAKLVQDEAEKTYFIGSAKQLLETMATKCGSFDDETQGLIRLGTVAYPNNRHVNVPIIYGDFYFMEALGKLQGLDGLF